MESIPLRPLSFLISIPLTGDPKIQLELYEIFNLPHPITPTLTLEYSSMPKFLAVSDDRLRYQEFKDMKDCRNHGQYYLCGIQAPIYRDDAPSCALNLFRNLLSDQQCDKHFSGKLRKPKLIKSSLGWLYSFSDPDIISITFPLTTERISIPMGSGQIETGPNCKVSGSQFLLPSSAEPMGDSLSVNISLVTPFNIVLNDKELEKVALMNESAILTNIMTLNQNKMPLKALKNEVKDLKYIHKMRKINSITGNAGLALSSISFIGVVALIVIVLTFCRVALNERQRKTIRNVITFSPGQNNDQQEIMHLNDPVTAEITSGTMLYERDTTDQLELTPIAACRTYFPQSPTLIRTNTGNRQINPTDRFTQTLSQQSDQIGELTGTQ